MLTLQNLKFKRMHGPCFLFPSFVYSHLNSKHIVLLSVFITLNFIVNPKYNFL